MTLQRVKQIARGCDRLFDFAGSYTYQDYSESIAQRREYPPSICTALASDWHTAGRDMWHVFGRSASKV
ncbi:MAG: hypothetical protein CSA20_01600 [Deltaproteobacteria bacterium]|nr:MAG: hypothetical protein CSA20_01600 [Deltaproteobacteria bacterium]